MLTFLFTFSFLLYILTVCMPFLSCCSHKLRRAPIDTSLMLKVLLANARDCVKFNGMHACRGENSYFLYQNKVNCSLTSIQRQGCLAGNCTLGTVR